MFFPPTFPGPPLSQGRIAAIRPMGSASEIAVRARGFTQGRLILNRWLVVRQFPLLSPLDAIFHHPPFLFYSCFDTTMFSASNLTLFPNKKKILIMSKKKIMRIKGKKRASYCFSVIIQVGFHTLHRHGSVKLMRYETCFPL